MNPAGTRRQPHFPQIGLSRKRSLGRTNRIVPLAQAPLVCASRAQIGTEAGKRFSVA